VSFLSLVFRNCCWEGREGEGRELPIECLFIRNFCVGVLKAEKNMYDKCFCFCFVFLMKKCPNLSLSLCVCVCVSVSFRLEFIPKKMQFQKYNWFNNYKKVETCSVALLFKWKRKAVLFPVIILVLFWFDLFCLFCPTNKLHLTDSLTQFPHTFRDTPQMRTNMIVL